MGSVALSGIRKSFGAVEVLHGIDLDVKDGEFVVLVGPSGCGKSTLLRTLAGLETISSGDIRIDDAVVTQLHPKKRNIAMVFQNYALYPNMTVAQNMSFSLKMAKVAKETSDRKVADAAAILGLEDLLHRYPRQLSGGQRQRVAMGRAIVRDPSVFLFDEPLSNLDAKLRVQMRSEIKELHQRLKTTTIYVTHDQIEAMTMADRIVVMKDGFVEQVGTPRELYRSPTNLFVAGFIGSPAMNMIDARIDAGHAVLEGEIRLPLPSGVASGNPSVTLGIRPEDFVLTPEGLPAKVSVVEPTGADTHVVLHVAGTAVTVDTRDEVDLRPGDVVHLDARPDKIHVFDRESGVALRPSEGYDAL